MITIKQTGDFSKLDKYLTRVKKAVNLTGLDEYGKQGVALLSRSTPVDTGLTASSWYYEISQTEDSTIISFNNSNINKGVSIALILQYGHGTRNGGWVQGIDYINPAIQPLFTKMAEDAWKEITKV